MREPCPITSQAGSRRTRSVHLFDTFSFFRIDVRILLFHSFVRIISWFKFQNSEVSEWSFEIVPSPYSTIKYVPTQDCWGGKSKSPHLKNCPVSGRANQKCLNLCNIMDIRLSPMGELSETGTSESLLSELGNNWHLSSFFFFVPSWIQIQWQILFPQISINFF